MPQLLDELDADPAARLTAARLVLAEVRLERSTRDIAHHRPGTWTTEETTEAVQQRLF